MESDPFARRLKDQYLNRRVADLKALGALLRDADFPAIRQIGHKLYGSGSAYGFEEISRVGGALERAADAEASQQVAAAIEDLEKFLHSLTLP